MIKENELILTGKFLGFITFLFVITLLFRNH